MVSPRKPWVRYFLNCWLVLELCFFLVGVGEVVQSLRSTRAVCAMLLCNDRAHVGLLLAEALNSSDSVPTAPLVLGTERGHVRWGWGGDRDGVTNKGLFVSVRKEAVGAQRM